MPETTVELIQTGPEESELIRNLYQYYAYESSDWEQEDVEADGRFYIHDEHLNRYWQDPQWSANLLLVDGYIAGFLLIEGSEMIRRVGWCTGGGQGYIDQAIAAGVDLYLTGEASEQTFHSARENGISFIAAGHHATERYGVQALGDYLARRFAIEHLFIDCPNPI